MSKSEFAITFFEGMNESGGDPLIALRNVLGILYDTREKAKHDIIQLEGRIRDMDELADENTIEYRCKACKEPFTADEPLSVMAGSELYCGKNQWCTP